MYLKISGASRVLSLELPMKIRAPHGTQLRWNASEDGGMMTRLHFSQFL